MIEADAQRSADTHLLRYPLPPEWNVQLYLKDESTHITGSLKHRLARSLFLYSICNGWVGENTTVIEASSGSTAVSEAYFAKLLGLDFVAVMPASTSPAKIALIEAQGGRCHFVDDPSSIYAESRAWPSRPAATTWTSSLTPNVRPTGAGTTTSPRASSPNCSRRTPDPGVDRGRVRPGGTGATIGRFLRYRKLDTGLCVVDPENSVFFDAWRSGDCGTAPTFERGSRIEGIGRPRVEPSFIGQVIDRMVKVPDAGSIAAMRHASDVLDGRWAARPAPICGARSVWSPRCSSGAQRQRGDAVVRWRRAVRRNLLRRRLGRVGGHRPGRPAAVLAEFTATGRWTA
ncbi:pyridoxal-phosphate dependent enzyme [Rhodococcus hoagii]|nr:pyridoxal-phosphate dependent enzyme [Prescottella equi]